MIAKEEINEVYEANKTFKKIDIHCHTTDRKLTDVAESDASLTHILEKMEENNVRFTVLLATYFPHKGSGISNYRLLDWLRKEAKEDDRNLLMFGSLDFEYYFWQGYNELEELANDGHLSGIKMYSGYQDIDYSGDKVNMVFKLAEKNGLPVMFHGGYSRGCMRKYGRPAFSRNIHKDEIVKLANDFGNTNIIISHLNTPFQEELMEVMDACKNIFTDMSGIVSSSHDRKEIPDVIEITKKVLGAVGPDRLMFGTDFPVQTHEDSVYMLHQAMEDFNLSYESKRSIFFYNAFELLGLSAKK